MIVAPNEDDIFDALRAFLQDVLPPSATTPAVVPHIVIVGQENRVPEPVNAASPANSNYVVMVPLRMPRLSTNREVQASLGLALAITQSSQCVIQLDIHGPQAFNNSSIISTMFRSSYGVDFFAARATADMIAPLFADDPRQMQFSSGEQQYEDRYIVEANLQVNQTITAPAQSARELTLGITDVETDPDSWPNAVVTVQA